MKLNHLGFEPKRFAGSLLIVALTLVASSLVIKLTQLYFDPPHMRTLISLFYVDSEHNIPTWYSLNVSPTPVAHIFLWVKLSVTTR